jgi:hypothetical protein
LVAGTDGGESGLIGSDDLVVGETVAPRTGVPVLIGTGGLMEGERGGWLRNGTGGVREAGTGNLGKVGEGGLAVVALGGGGGLIEGSKGCLIRPCVYGMAVASFSGWIGTCWGGIVVGGAGDWTETGSLGTVGMTEVTVAGNCDMEVNEPTVSVLASA